MLVYRSGAPRPRSTRNVQAGRTGVYHRPSGHADLVETVIVDAEVVGQLMEDGLADLLPDLGVVGANRFDGALVDRDLIGQDEVVELAAAGDRDTRIEPEEGVPAPDASGPKLARRRCGVDDDVDVVNAGEEARRQRGDGLADQAAELAAFQREAQRRTAAGAAGAACSAR